MLPRKQIAIIQHMVMSTTSGARWGCCERILWMKKRAKNRAVVEKIEESESPTIFSGNHNLARSDNPEVAADAHIFAIPSRCSLQVLPPQPSCLTHKSTKTCESFFILSLILQVKRSILNIKAAVVGTSAPAAAAFSILSFYKSYRQKIRSERI